MKNVTKIGLLVLLAAAIGCDSGKQGATKNDPPPKENKEHGHGHGPNGGVVFDLGKYHAEFTVNHDKKECTVLILSGEEKDAKPTAVAAKEFTLTTKETKTKEGKIVPPMTIKLLPSDVKDGKASKFVGSDPGLGNVADFEGTVLGEIDGKPSQGEFKE